MVSDRRLFFMGDALRNDLPTILDWTDSLTLHYWRALGARIRGLEFGGLYGFLRDYQANVAAEWYYGRRAHLNTTVSRVDKRWFDRTNFRPERNRLWMNGTKIEERASVAKVAKRLIFSGAMDYTPNHEGALWFIDEVFPLVLKRHPDATFVVAGVNPVAKLAGKASDRIQITGFVEDLGAEIARSSLYVAPLLSGGGFRNKVVEALAKGTYLVGTPMSVEFLPDNFQKLIPVADDAAGFAELVVTYLDDPAAYQDRLEQLRQVVISDFSWRGRTDDLLRFLAEAEQNFRS
jgi:glycosyltransferase involved in cell wall biosynthesis